MKVKCWKSPNNNIFTNGLYYNVIRYKLKEGKVVKVEAICNNGQIKELSKGFWLERFIVINNFFIPNWYYKLNLLFKT